MDLEINKFKYAPDLMDTLRGLLPGFVVMDVGKVDDSYSACAELFSALAKSNILLIGDEDISQYKFLKTEAVFHTPFKAYIQRPLNVDKLTEQLKEIGLGRPESKWGSQEVSDEDLINIFKNDVLMGNLFKGVASQEQIETAADILGMKEGEKRYCRVFIAKSANEEQDPIPNNFALFAFLRRQISCRHLVTVAGSNKLLGIVSTSSEDLLMPGMLQWRTLERWLKDQNIIPPSISISLSPVFSDISQLPYAYKCADTGLLQSFYTGYRSLIESTTPEVNNVEFRDIKQTLDDFASYVFSFDRQGMEKYLDDLYQDASRQSVHELVSIRALYVRFLLRIELGENRLKKIYVPEVLLAENIHSIVQNMPTLTGLHRLLSEKVEHIFDGVLEKSSSAQLNTMHVIEHIHLNYRQQELSVQTISENLYLSPSHISAEFKKVMGIPVSKYITDYRIKQTKHLLNNPKNNLEYVAKMAGYSNAHQFSRVFKRVTGIRPSEYKMRLGA